MYSSTCKMCIAIGKCITPLYSAMALIVLFTGNDFGTITGNDFGTVVPVSTSSSPSQTSLIAGLTAGVVVGITGVLTCIALFVVFMRRCKSSTSIEQPHHDYVEPPSQPPTLYEEITVEENNAYGTHPRLTSPTSSLQSNAAYEACSELQENDAYEPHSTVTSSSPSLQSNAAYGFSPLQLNDGTV